VLTSGTLSAAGDFSRIKRTLGIDFVKNRVTEISKPSPFNYRKNSLIYIPENIPFPDQNSDEYILAVANGIEKLIYASHGHAAVLFTSYKAMDKVWEHLSKRSIPFPMFRLGKGSVREIERFKKSGNGILFAAGALWEGIDPNKLPPITKWQTEREKLTAEKKRLDMEYSKLRTETAAVEKIKRSVDDILNEETGTPQRTRKHDIEH
jgi:hypothetical protein